MLKKIINPWIEQPRYNCFGCSPNNPFGLHLEFFEDGDSILTEWHPNTNYQGWIDTVHGGILSTLIDETCGWVVSRKMQTSGYTVSLSLRYRKTVSTTERCLTVQANIVKQEHNLLFIHAAISNSKGEICVEGEATYFLMKPQQAVEMGFAPCKTEDE